MAVIKFTAVNRGELPSWLAAGATFYLANNFQAFPRGLVAKGDIDETLDGTPEGYLHALQREYSIQTDFIPLHERDLWRAFFTSVMNAETFSIDLTARQLLGNPGFESGALAPWAAVAPSTAAVNTAQPVVGSYSAQVTIAPSVASSIFQNEALAGLVGRTYLLQGIAQRSESSVPNRSAALTTRWGDSGGAFISATTVATAAFGTSGAQRLSGTVVAPASTAFVTYRYDKPAPFNTDEAGVWHFDHSLLALLSSWLDVWLVDRRIEEQQIGGVGVQYRFKVKTVP